MYSQYRILPVVHQFASSVQNSARSTGICFLSTEFLPQYRNLFSQYICSPVIQECVFSVQNSSCSTGTVFSVQNCSYSTRICVLNQKPSRSTRNLFSQYRVLPVVQEFVFSVQRILAVVQESVFSVQNCSHSTRNVFSVQLLPVVQEFVPLMATNISPAIMSQNRATHTKLLLYRVNFMSN